MGRLELGEQYSAPEHGEVTAREVVHNDAGVILAGFALDGLLRVVRGKNRVVTWAAGLGVASGAAMAFGHNMDYVGATSAADLQTAGTSVHGTLIQFDREKEINVAKAYFDVTVDARDITYQINSRPFDVVPDCPGNKQIRGIGAIGFHVPFNALEQQYNPATDKADIAVNPQMVTAEAYWDDAGPEERDYTIHNGKKNFSDRSGFCRSFFDMVASQAKLINLDSLGNIMDDLDKAVAHDLRKKGLEMFSQQCPKEIEPHLRNAIADAIRDNVAALDPDDRGDLGEITFGSEALQWNFDKGPSRQVRQHHKFSSDYRIQSFAVDNVSCSVDPSAVPDLLGDEL